MNIEIAVQISMICFGFGLPIRHAKDVAWRRLKLFESAYWVVEVSSER